MIEVGKSCFDYEGYGRTWLCKSDLTPKKLKQYGIKASVKEIKNRSGIAIDGFVTTGGMGHSKRVSTYSINQLKEIFKK